MTNLEACLVGAVMSLESGLRRTRYRAGAVIVYHGVGDSRPGSISSQVPERLFRAHLSFLRRRFHVVPAKDILFAVAGRRPGERFPVAVTFDDDLAAHVETALPALVNVGIPATFFVSGGSPDYWWQRLDQAFDLELSLDDILETLDIDYRALGGDLTVQGIARAMQAKTAAGKAAASARLRELVRHADQSPPPTLTAEAIRMLARTGMGVGFHTLDHESLPTLDEEALEKALTAGRPALEMLCGRPIRAIAYPHGDADRRVANAAHRAGYELGFTTDAQRVSQTTDPLRIGRLYPSPRSTSRLALRILWSLIAPAARPGTELT